MKRPKKQLPKIGTKTARSQFEYDVYKALQHELPKGASLFYETEKLSYILEKDYLPDFTIETKDGIIMYIEAKGLGRAFDYATRSKMEAVKKAHPEKDIRIVFMSDRPFRKGGKMKPSDWAIKHGYTYSIKEIPKEWFH